VDFDPVGKNRRVGRENNGIGVFFRSLEVQTEFALFGLLGFVFLG
jgi:hypothetical protein